MSISINVRMDTRGLHQVTGLIEDRLDKALTELAFEGERYTKLSFTISPSSPGEPPGVVTGALRSGVRASVNQRLNKQIISAQDYSIYLEFGTRNMAARPFMRPMVAWLRQQVPGVIGRHLKIGYSSPLGHASRSHAPARRYG